VMVAGGSTQRDVNAITPVPRARPGRTSG
jgi:hypothetical protein